jgi:hypothetical protein
MNSVSGQRGGSLFSNGQTPFDMYCDGKSYGEIVEESGLDLFTVMTEIAKEATIHAAFRSVNPYVEQEYQISQLHKVVDRAWDRVDSGDDEKGTALSVIVQAIRGISQVLHKGPASVPGTDEKPALPEGISPDTIAQLGQLQVRARFKQAGLVGLDGGKLRNATPEKVD